MKPHPSTGHDFAPHQVQELCRRRKPSAKNTTKARVRFEGRASVPYPQASLRFTKVRYRGIWKNHQWLCAAFALVNLYQHRNRLAPQRA